MMRAVHVVMLVVALIVGLPALAHAHAGHGEHDQMISRGVQKAKRGPMPMAKPFIAAQALVSFSHGPFYGVSTRDTQTSSSRGAVVSVAQDTSIHSCACGCCCPGMSGCGMGACCQTILTSDASAFDFSGAGAHMSHRLYGSAALTIILGLDRPPKA